MGPNLNGVRKYQALTLIETVVASFILLCSFLVVLNLFHSTFNHMSRTETHQLAAMISERQFERMRVWSETLNGTVYNYDNPGLAAHYNGTSTPSDFGNFNITTNVTTQGLYSPCSEFEENIPLSPPLITRRYLSASAAKVQVTVDWYDHGPRQLRAVSIFSRPALQWASAGCVTIPDVPPNPLPHDATATFTATGIDSNGAPMVSGSDIFFVWQVNPVSGMGTVSQARDGSVAQLTNLIYMPPCLPTQVPPFLGVKFYTGGQCYLQASARYHGQTVTVNSSSVVNLQ